MIGGIIIKKLVIAEKTSAAKSLMFGLGSDRFDFHEVKKYKPPNAKCGYYESDSEIITYACGHILTLQTIEDYMGLPASPRQYDNLPYIPSRFLLKTADNPWAKDQFNVLKKLINRNDVDTIVHFGDPDNEGELIIREILQSCNNTKPVKRLWCRALEPSVIADAYYDLKDDNKYSNIYYEALARQQTDWLYGINVSRFITAKTHKNFPAGRVLVPIVAFISERDKEIENFVKGYSYGIDAEVKKGEWSCKLINSTPAISFSKDEKAECEKVLDVLKICEPYVEDISIKTKTVKPYHLFNLSALQALMNKRYGYDLDFTLKTVQSLYEKAFVTYPRTASEYLTKAQINDTEKIVNMLKSQGKDLIFNENSSIFDDDKCEGGHTALVITKKFPSNEEFKSFSDAEKRVYLHIYNRFVSNFAPNAKIEETTVTVKADKYTYKIVGNRVIEQGFMKYETKPIKQEIPEFRKGEKVNMTFSLAKRETSPPSHVTPAELLDFLQNPYKKELAQTSEEKDKEYYELLKSGATLGTDATTGTIVANAEKYGYIKKKGKSFLITDKGNNLLDLLHIFGINLFKDKNIEINKNIKRIGRHSYTLEKNKDDIAAELIESFNNSEPINITIKQGDDPIANCPKCGSPVYEKLNSFQCSNPDCKFHIFKNDKFFAAYHRKINKTMAKNLITKGRTTLNSLTSKNGNKYSIIIKVDYKNTDFDAGEFPKYTTEFPKKKK